MNVRTLCLAILNMGDATGYEIRKMSTETEYSYFVDASYGSIYPALNKLEKDGRVTCRLEEQQGKPARKIYSITDAGRDEFIETLKIAPQHDLFKSEFLLLAMNANLIDQEIIQSAINRRFAFLKEEIAIIEAACCDDSHDGHSWVSRYGKFCVEASLKFLEDNQHELLAMCKPAAHQAKAAE